MPQSIRPGDLLAGRYRLVDLLVESGGGRFYRAHDRVLERQVAVHVIGADDPRADGLLEAARRSATVPDRRLLRVLDADRGAGLCFVVNEWGSGTSLDRWLAGPGTLAAHEAAWLVAEVADSLTTAHLRGVAHGRLAPENVLVDRNGGVRIIGFCVEAALHGLPPGRTDDDVADLAGLLYAALTGRWAGASQSGVPAAPRDHGRVLRPRQVRAGIPRPLDAVCDEVLNPERRGHVLTEASARAVCDLLTGFVGDPGGIPEVLAERNPAGVRPETVSLPALPDLPVREPDEPTLVVPLAEPAPEPGPEEQAAGAGGRTPDHPGEAPHERDDERDDDRDDEQDDGEAGALPGAVRDGLAPGDQPTEAGMPVFGEDDDVAWLRARSTPPPPPPPFEEPPERPLFAPEPEGGWPTRPPRPAPAGAHPTGAGFWPWDTGTGRGTGTALTPVPGDDEQVPGRRWLVLATAVALAVLLLLAVVVAYNLGRGRTPLGAEPATDDPTSASPSATPEPTPITGVTANDLDPQGAPPQVENPDLVGLAVDGDPATAWRTQTYEQDFGPQGLKTGVGLVLDLGSPRPVSAVDLTFVGEPTGVELYVTDGAPDQVADLEPVRQLTAGARERVELDEAVTGRYVTVWLTSLPQVADGWRGEVAEVVVRG